MMSLLKKEIYTTFLDKNRYKTSTFNHFTMSEDLSFGNSNYQLIIDIKDVILFNMKSTTICQILF